MLSALMPLAAALLLSADVASQPGAQWVFRGNVAQLRPDHTLAEPKKTFDVTYFVAESSESATKLYWLVEERGQGHWPWSERFGELEVNAQGQPGGAPGPSLLYDYGEGKSVLPLPLPLLAPDRKLNADSAWQLDGRKYQVEQEKRLAGRDAWQVEVLNNFGRKATVWVGKDSPLVIGADERVFMNKGTEYRLQMRLVTAEPADAETASQTTAAFSALVELRAKLNRPSRTEADDWNDAQLALLASNLPAIAKTAANGPLAKLVSTAGSDLEAQSGRADAVQELVARFQGQPAPKFSINGLSQAKLSEADLTGNVTLLHFWDYRNAPLEEPYGQVGYLEFLFNRHKAAGLKMYGVAVDGRFGDASTRGAATSGVRKLKAFMNLSYPILLDSGSLVKQFGDPRLVGAALPLFAVLGPDGKILHYHVGYYPVDLRQGLKELDEVVAKALKSRKP